MNNLYDSFLTTANRYPDNHAVITNNGFNTFNHVSYSSLTSESVKVSTCLEMAGAFEGHFIGLHMEQTICLPALILGILHQGSAFTCLDLAASHEHCAYVFKQLNMRWLFTVQDQVQTKRGDSSSLRRLRSVIEVQGVTLNLWEISENQLVGFNRSKSKMAYAVMTSGTTGKQKCVRVPQKCIVPNINHISAILSVVPSDVIFLGSPLTFDPSVVELFLALLSGAALLIVPSAIRASPDCLIATLFPKLHHIYSGVTILQSTPSVVARWPVDVINKVLLGCNSTLRALVLGGEPCPPANILKLWKKDPKNETKLFNAYGITEVSCWAMMQTIDLTKEVTGKHEGGNLGLTLMNTSVQVRDDLGQVLQAGIGEIFIGGSTRICLIDDEPASALTSPVFRATGDMAKIDGKTGAIRFICRRDRIIKRFGHKVNLVLMEKLVNECGIIEWCCCVWDQNLKKLGLFVKFAPNVFQSISQLKAHLIKNTVQAAVPDIIVTVTDVPVTAHGKTDSRRLLQQLASELVKESTKIKRTESITNAFSKLWVKYLRCEVICEDACFISLGGDSMIALQIVGELENGGYEVSHSLIPLLLKNASFMNCSNCLAAFDNSARPPTGPTVKEPARSLKVEPNSENVAENERTVAAKRQKIMGRNSTVTAEESRVFEDNSIVFSASRGKIHSFSEPNVIIDAMKRVDKTFKLQLEVGWKYDLGKCVDTSPLFIKFKSGRGLVVVGSHSHDLAILDSTTGLLASPLCYCGDRIESSACVDLAGYSVIVGCYDGHVLCVKLQGSSEVLWKFYTGKMVKSSAVLCMDGSAAVIGSYDGNLYCLRVRDGRLLWSTLVCYDESSVSASACSSRVHHMVYVATLSGACRALQEADGKFVWSASLSSAVFSSPVLIANDSQVLFTEVEGSVHAYSPERGEKLWTFKAGGNIFSTMCELKSNLHRYILFGCHDKYIYCLEQETDDETFKFKWQLMLNSSVYSTPFAFEVEQDVLDTAGGKQSRGKDLTHLVVAASTSGTIYVIDVRNASALCSYRLPSSIFSSPVAHQNQIVVGCRDNQVYSLNIK